MLVTMANSKVFAKEVYDHLVTLSAIDFPEAPSLTLFSASPQRDLV
ncbi:Uncharacterised protein [Legionella taurinensis]|nr:hypothetical protein [Legionella taurinensis]STY64945.1 Uncharacterised protein [Legionella taurinensis]